MIWDSENKILFSSLISNRGSPVTFQDVALGHVKQTKYFCLRHDIDHYDNLENMIHFAVLEYKLGISSTIFIKMADYFQYSQKFVDKLKVFVDLGHNIGLHIDVIEHFRNQLHNVKQIIEIPLNFLRKHGIYIYGVSAHGGKNVYNYAFNYEMWKELDPSKNEIIGKLSIPKISLMDLELLYETYFLDFDFFFGDSAGVWCGTRKLIPLPFEKHQREHKENIGLKIFDIHDQEGGFLQVLIHPTNRWRFI